MRAAFLAAAIACAFCGNAFALQGSNGTSLNLAGVNGTNLNLSGLNGLGLNMSGMNGRGLNLGGVNGTSNSGATVDLNSLRLVRAAIRH